MDIQRVIVIHQQRERGYLLVIGEEYEAEDEDEEVEEEDWREVKLDTKSFGWEREESFGRWCNKIHN